MRLRRTILAASLLLPLIAWPQASNPAESATSGPVLAAGDQIVVRMFDFPETLPGVTVHLAGDGTVTLPYAGTLPAAGQTPEELQRSIDRSLRDKQIVKEPNVIVDVVAAINFAVTVQGQVVTPRMLPLFAPAPLSYVLSQVGGLTSIASPKLAILHRGDQMPTSIDYDLRHPSSEAMNTLVHPGDIINVSNAGVFFVGGEVGHPGVYPMGGALSVGQSSVLQGEGIVEHMTLLEALSDAGGITAIAKRSRLHILRTENGKRIDINVDQVKLSNGEVADPVIQPNDIIYIPPSYLRLQTNNLFSTALSSLYAVTSIQQARF